MKMLVLKPIRWPCSLAECPTGPFVFEDQACFKSEYRGHTGCIEAYNRAGELFWAGTHSVEEQAKIMVQPVEAVWVEAEEG